MAKRSQKDQAAEQEAQEQAQQEQQGEGQEELTEEQKQAAFEEAVEEARTDIGGAMTTLMGKHEVAVRAKSAFTTSQEAWESKNKKSIENRKGAQARLAAARTALLADWNGRSTSGEEVTEGEGEEARTFLADLNFGFDEHADPEDKASHLEKEYWLAAQSYQRIVDTGSKEPTELAGLREVAEAAEAEYADQKAIYDEALRRQLT